MLLCLRGPDIAIQTAGANGKLELDFAIDRTGRVAPAHAARYAEFGAWIRQCYGSPVARTTPAPGAREVVLALPPGVAIDRVMIQEDQTNGQCVAGYIVDAFAGGEWTVVARGVTIGNKRIEVFAAPIVASVVRLTVTDVFDRPTLSNFAAFAPQPCALPSTAVRAGMFVFL